MRFEMLWLLVALGCGKADETCDPAAVDCGQPACRSTCDADGDGADALSLGGDDCDDGDAAISPTAPEICDDVDDDCDGLVDDADTLDPSSPTHWFDVDGDGFGDPNQPTQRCALAGTVDDDSDCDDLDPDVHPGAADICDGVLDNDCDRATDPSEADADGDGATPCGGDCDDADAATGPAALEICNDDHDDDCDGLLDLDDDSVDVWTCDYCPPWTDWDTHPIEIDTYNPCVLDPLNTSWGCSTDPNHPDTNTDGERLHRVVYRTDLTEYRPQLFLWFPPSAGNFNFNILHYAAYAGYRVIGLGYPNDDLDWGLNCVQDLGDCYGNGRNEILWGDDTSPYLDISWADSAVGRAVTLLQYLDAQDPTVGWANYIAPSGDDLEWDNIVVMGWSEGGTNVGYLVHEVEPYGAIFLSSPEDELYDVGQDLASFYYTPFNTPGCAMWGAFHLYEDNVIFWESYDQMEIPGDKVIIEDSAPPYGGSHRLTTALDGWTKDDCNHHKSMAMDYCMAPELAEPYISMMCQAGNQDRVTSCPWSP